MNIKLAFSLLAFFLLLIIGHLFIITQNVSLKYQLTDLKVRYREIINQNRELGSQVSRNENLALIEKYAAEKLGMVYPARIKYLTGGAPTKIELAAPTTRENPPTPKPKRPPVPSEKMD